MLLGQVIGDTCAASSEPRVERRDYKNPSARMEFHLCPSFPQHLETGDHLQLFLNHTIRPIDREVTLSFHAEKAVLLGKGAAGLG